MPVVRVTCATALWCAFLTVGCRGTAPDCPQASVTADPQEIPSGVNQTALSVDVNNPFPDNGLVLVTELTTLNGVIGDPFALETTDVCAHDVSGPVEICANATYRAGPARNAALSEVPNVGAAYEYIRSWHVRLTDPLECCATRCINIACPEYKNPCPEVSRLAVEPMVLPEGETATVTVVGDDPDDNPEALVATLSARHGTIADPHANETTYACGPDLDGVIEICIEASDREAASTAQHRRVQDGFMHADPACPTQRV